MSIIRADPGIDPAYQHKPKLSTSFKPLETSGALLKWYGINYENYDIPDEVTRLAREYLNTTPIEARGMGFVLLHRCGEDFYFLIVCTWRNSNELWETVFYKDGDAMTDFALVPRDGDHKPTLCVWELVPVWHEQQAWVRFLMSSRDEEAAGVWLHDCIVGFA